MSATKNREAEFAYGSGPINPVNAANPGLIYDAGESDYIQFLCGQGYSNESFQLVTGSSTTTCSASNNGTVWDPNYPSFALSGPAGASVTRAFRQAVTNVGSPVSTYKATMVPLPRSTNLHSSPSGRLGTTATKTLSRTRWRRRHSRRRSGGKAGGGVVAGV
ncbi:hypothetical protein RHSIM_Rhsim03G0137500 [Rhododendron simsii]|uniref:Uncharacterized protein n=1 Tax=Rhododendron simsii TaxID=118357 RepID=A0A834HH24_RHOSS|nr:hypothetical protein RHSIM_Rhsim03G0137500 [Rhododendron simsii]